MSSYSPARTVAVLGITLATILVSGGFAALPARADANDLKPGIPHSLSAAVEVATDQFIVGIKDKAGTASIAAREAATEAASKVGARATGLRQTATGAHVVKTDRALPAAEAEGFLTALRADPDVEYAEPDAIMQTTASVEPNDSYYPLQWDFWEERGSLRVPGAWEVNRGAGVVVAVVDTGITGHSDLDANVLPGYDMISSAAIARDGNGRDADPTDEGDWVSAGQCSSSNGDGISSWHGTHVAGTIAAISDNNNGVTGVAPEAKIIPLRAVGACGGYTSDIADSIVWAAGGVVAGTSANANPARVINLSLGGSNTCSATYQNAINFAYNSGAAVVVAAGNSNRPAADSSPANCQNVITVASSGRSGARAPYSNYGSVVDVTAPGGDMSSDVYGGILSTSNFGSTTPDEEAYEFLQGTSMAAPHVAGVAALMMSEMGAMMTPAKVEARLKETARPLAFTCWVGCGSGLVDAAAALDFVVGEIPVVPATVTFSDVDGALGDNYTIPTSEGVQYVVGGEVVAAGTYPGSGTVTVLAEVLPGYAFADGTVKAWAHTFDATSAPVDVAGPVVVSHSVSPTSFSLSDGPAVVKVSLRMTDQTGADAPVVSFRHDVSGQTAGLAWLELVSGDNKDGVWEGTTTIPQGAATGQWTVRLFGLSDSLGNSSAGPDPLAVLDVSGPPSDVAGPVVVSHSVSPTSFNLADGPAVVKVSLRMTDETGADAPVVSFRHDVSGQTAGLAWLELVSGDNKDGVWEGTTTIPQGAATGQWTVRLFGLSDSLGNSSSGPEPLAVLDVSGPLSDVEGPVVVSHSVSPTSFNLVDGPAVVKVTLRMTDQTGADAPVVNMSHAASGQTQGFGWLELVSGDNKDGVWERTMTIPQDAATGQWTVRLFGLSDSLGNSSAGPDPLAVLDVSKQLPLTPVTPAAVVFADEDGTASDTFTIPNTEGVEYVLHNEPVAAGTYSGAGSVTVNARPKADYVLASGAAAEWSHTFKATPYPVTPAAVTFMDKDGTAEDVFTVPSTDGVEYFVGENVKAAGAHPGTGTVTVKARAKTDYVLASGAAAEWSHTFKATPYPVTPAAVTFTDNDGTAEDVFTVPSTDGVEYFVGENVKAAGMHPGTGTVTVTARAKIDYVLASGAVAEWSHTFKATPYAVTPPAVVFVDGDGTATDSYTIPVLEGVEYLVAEKVLAAGSYPGSGTVTVTARAKTDYVLASGAAAEWSHTFKATPYAVTPAAVVFVDGDGTASDTYTIPTSEGIEYVVGGLVVAAGQYPGSGTVLVKAREKADYVFTAGVTVEWSHTFSSAVAPVPGSLRPVAPFRALDTRSGSPVAPDSSTSFQVAGVNGIPQNVAAVVFNLTVAEAKNFGFVTAYASGTARPYASNVNFGEGQIVPNAVTVPVGADGRVALYNRSAGTTHLLADVSGYYLPGQPTAPGAFQAIAPTRFLDTRDTTAVRPDSAVTFQVAGVHGVPANVSAVVFNLTVAHAENFGYATAYPSGTTRPNASNVNFLGGQIVPNSVTVPVGADGKVALFNRSAGSTHLVADVAGYFIAGTPTASGTFQAVAPSRFLDTRDSVSVSPDSFVSFQVGGRNGIPADASAVVFNMTVAQAQSFGYATAYASGTARPNASNVNFLGGQIVPNSVTVPIGADGRVALFNRSDGATHLIADVSGYYLR